MVKPKQNPVHVLIKDPNDVRRHILLGGIDAIKSLEKYEIFKKMKNLKKRKFLDLNERLKALNNEITNLVNVLPELKEHRIQKHISKIEYREETSHPKRSKEDEKFFSLRKEMRDIQDKLSRLNF